MIKKFVIVAVLSLSISLVHGQRKEKIKGSKVVSIENTSIDEFSRILIGEDIKIALKKGEEPMVEIKTDENLHEVILVEVLDNTLLIKSTKKITSKKELEITVTYTDALTLIEGKDNAQISALNTVNIPELTIKATGSSKIFITLKSDLFKLINSDRSKAELNVTAISTTLELSDSSRLEALINSTVIKVDLYQKAYAKIEGDVDTLAIRADNSSNFIGKELTSNTCSVLSEGSSDVYIQVIEDLSIDASGNSEIYLYENPKITINKFTDTVKLHKKEL